MWPFTKKYTLLDTDFFKGWTDHHSHILFGVDDGIRTLDDSLAVLAYYEELGVSKVWLTPHIMEDMPNEPSELKERFARLSEAYDKACNPERKIKLCLSAENMMDMLFVKRLEEGNLMPYGDNGQELLVETSYVQPPTQFKKILMDIKKAGFTPVLAHPERYRYMGEKSYEELQEMGVRFQMNVISLVGGYGESARKNAEFLLSENKYSYSGSDLHHLGAFRNALSAKVLKKDVMELINR